MPNDNFTESPLSQQSAKIAALEKLLAELSAENERLRGVLQRMQENSDGEEYE